MKIHLVSDLHLRSASYAWPVALDCGVAVVAGDVCEDIETAACLLEACPHPVVLVLGNHDYWSDRPDTLEVRLAAWRERFSNSRVRLLENESCVIGSVRFLGCTLWTNYGCGVLREAQQLHLEHAAMALVRDHEFIAGDTESRELTAQALRARHFESVRWLRHELGKPKEGWSHTLVVTHHPPTWRVLTETGMVSPASLQKARIGVSPGLLEAARLGAYSSELDELLLEFSHVISAWCSGHVHKALTLKVGGVPLHINARGSASSLVENFNPRRVIELPTGPVRQHDAALSAPQHLALLALEAPPQPGGAKHTAPASQGGQEEFAAEYRSGGVFQPSGAWGQAPGAGPDAIARPLAITQELPRYE